MMAPELVKTDDGSDTLFLPELGERYHSTFGAIQESHHVFVEAGLRKCKQSQLILFEVGFGTGLNAYLTLIETLRTQQIIRYITVEKYPLPPSIWEVLNYPTLISEGSSDLFMKIHEADWNEEVKITDCFSILKLSSDLSDVDYSTLPLLDLIYFDAFSPGKQPELWSTPVFRQISDHCSPAAKFVTYCAKGEVRRSLNEVGFTTERIPGPQGKREMLRGTKILLE